MKIKLFLFILLICCSSVYGMQITGHVTLTVLNAPPAIRSVDISPNPAYSDSPVSCIANVTDQTPDKLEFYFLWYKNDYFIKITNENVLTPENFDEGDKITCSVVVSDSEFNSTNMTNTAIAIPAAGSKITKNVLNLVGVSTDYATIESIKEEKGLTGITGFAVKEISLQPVAITFRFLILVGLVLVFIIIRLGLKFRSSKHPKQGYLFS